MIMCCNQVEQGGEEKCKSEISAERMCDWQDMYVGEVQLKH